MWLWWSWTDNISTFGASRYNDGPCTWYSFSVGRTCSGVLGSRCGHGIIVTPRSRLIGRVERSRRLQTVYWFTSCRGAAGFITLRRRRGCFHLVSFFALWRRRRMGSLAFLWRWANLLSGSRSIAAFVVIMVMLLSLFFFPLLLLCSCTG